MKGYIRHTTHDISSIPSYDQINCYSIGLELNLYLENIKIGSPEWYKIQNDLEQAVDEIKKKYSKE